MKFEHKKLGTFELVDMKQRHVEKYLDEIAKISLETPQQVYHGQVVRAAVACDMVVTKIEDVGELNPGIVRWYSECIIKALQEAITIPPE